MALTKAQKQKNYRARKSIRGLKLVQEWVPERKEAKLRKYAAELRG